MNKSHYNFVREQSGKEKQFVLFNSRTGCLSVLDLDHYSKYLAYPEKEIEDAEFLDQLINCGYIVESLNEEYDLIRYQMYRARFSSSFMNLVIAPTMNCNLACTYCYEKKQQTDNLMSETVQDAIIAYLLENVQVLKKLNIEWYGGEPLLATKVIDRINERILSICSENNIQCYEQMITNGYLLDEAHIDFLNRNQIKKIQVTLDGVAETHDRRRIHKSGAGTYNTIINNLKQCKMYYKGCIDLRVNVDKTNINDIDELAAELEKEGLKGFVNIYLGRVTNANEVMAKEACLSCQCFADYSINFIIKNKNLNRYLEETYPNPIGNRCAADYNLSWIIAPNGDLYKCHMEIGQTNCRVGNILDVNKINIAFINNRLMWDPTKDAVCSGCKYLPICMGGCDKERIGLQRKCDYKKYILDYYLSDISYIE